MNRYSGPPTPTPDAGQKPSPYQAGQHMPGFDESSGKRGPQGGQGAGQQGGSWDPGRAASDAASAVGMRVKDLFDSKVGAGAGVLHTLANSVVHMAEDLGKDTPQIAELVRVAAGRLDEFAHNIQDRSVDELIRSASDFTRRQPALVFGLAAVAGFLVMRTIRNASVGARHSHDRGMHPDDGGQSGTGYHHGA